MKRSWNRKKIRIRKLLYWLSSIQLVFDTWTSCSSFSFILSWINGLFSRVFPSRESLLFNSSFIASLDLFPCFIFFLHFLVTTTTIIITIATFDTAPTTKKMIDQISIRLLSQITESNLIYHYQHQSYVAVH